MDFFSMCSTRIGNAFSFFIFHDSFFWGHRKGSVQFIESEIWGVLSTSIYCVVSQRPFPFNRHKV